MFCVLVLAVRKALSPLWARGVPGLPFVPSMSEPKDEIMRKPINVTWEDHPDARIVEIEWDCGCKIHSDDPIANVICADHRKAVLIT